MITKGIIVDIEKNKYKVRIPLLNGVDKGANSTSNETLDWAILSCPKHLKSALSKDDVVIIGFEQNDYGKPVILGNLYTEDNETNNLTDSFLNTLTVKQAVNLPESTTIGNITAKDIKALANTKDNLQAQIDLIKENGGGGSGSGKFKILNFTINNWTLQSDGTYSLNYTALDTTFDNSNYIATLESSSNNILEQLADAVTKNIDGSLSVKGVLNPFNGRLILIGETELIQEGSKVLDVEGNVTSEVQIGVDFPSFTDLSNELTYDLVIKTKDEFNNLNSTWNNAKGVLFSNVALEFTSEITIPNNVQYIKGLNSSFTFNNNLFSDNIINTSNTNLIIDGLNFGGYIFSPSAVNLLSNIYQLSNSTISLSHPGGPYYTLLDNIEFVLNVKSGSININNCDVVSNSNAVNFNNCERVSNSSGNKINCTYVEATETYVDAKTQEVRDSIKDIYDIVIGIDGNGYTANDCDIFIPEDATNCQTYIQQAINDLTSGGSIFIRRGTYNCSDRIALNKGCNITGESRGITNINTTSSYVMRVEANNLILNISKISLGYIGSALSWYRNFNVNYTDGQDINLEDVEFTGSGQAYTLNIDSGNIKLITLRDCINLSISGKNIDNWQNIVVNGEVKYGQSVNISLPSSGSKDVVTINSLPSFAPDYDFKLVFFIDGTGSKTLNFRSLGNLGGLGFQDQSLYSNYNATIRGRVSAQFSGTKLSVSHSTYVGSTSSNSLRYYEISKRV